MSQDGRSEEARGRILKHLVLVTNEPSTALDTRLLLTLGPEVACDSGEKNRTLVDRILQALPRLQQDPTPLTRLLSLLLQTWSLSDVLSLENAPDITQGLSLNAVPYNRFALSILEKATASPADVAHLARAPSLTYDLVKLWLYTSEMGIAEQAGEVIIHLLQSDMEPNDVAVHGVGDGGTASGPRGQGLMWRRMFSDKGVYNLFFAACDLRHSDDLNHGKREKSLSQARLMSFAVKLGTLDWEYLTRSHIPETERAYGLDPSKEGLLDFIALHMCDAENDVLMHMNLIQFYADLISQVRKPSHVRGRSVALEFMMDKDLHNHVISFWLHPDTHDLINVSFLCGPSAQYVSTYVSTYSQAFENDSQNVQDILTKLSNAFERLSANQWTHGQSSKHDLNILVSLPRRLLLPSRSLGTGRQSSPLLRIPCHNTNADALNSLAKIFQGPKKQSQVENSKDLDETDRIEAAAARALFITYLHYHESIFKDIISHAEIIAIPDKALAALNLIASIADANWLPSQTQSAATDNSDIPNDSKDLPTDDQLAFMLPGSSAEGFRQSGIAFLMEINARQEIYPYLNGSVRRFHYLMGGRGDPESAAYKITMAKWDLNQLVFRKLKECEDPSVTGHRSYNTVIQGFESTIKQGPWGPDLVPGGQVATLES